MTHSISKLVAAVVFLAAGTTFAQVYTVQTQTNVPYAPISGGTSVTLTARSSFTADDEGYADVPLGFTFPYYGSNYTSVHVDSNGFLLFGASTACNSGFVCYDGSGIPNATRTPHNVIAPWWDDEEGTPFTGPTGDIRTKQSPGQLEIEYANWDCYGGGCTFSYKVTLTASGLFTVQYGTMTGTGGSATVGFENGTGTAGANYLNCSSTSGSCTTTNWPTNTVYTIGQPVQPDIVVAAVNISGLNVDASNRITFTVNPTFQNYGQNPATPAFAWKAYLSTDRILDAADRLVFTSTPTVTLTGAGTAGASAMDTGAADSLTAVPPGQYYVIVDADVTNVVTEASETNNNAATTNYFVNGLDLVATSITGPAASGPGNPITIEAKWFNQGTNPAGMVSYRVLLSTDQLVSTGDFVLTSGTKAVTGGQTIDDMLSFPVPGNVPGGDFYYLLQIDPTNAIVEASETNNVVASSAKVTMKQADLVNTATDFLDPVTGASTRIGYFGEPGRVTVHLDNIGGANANNFKVAVVVSADSTLSLLSDTIILEQTVTQVAQGAGITLDIPFTFPLKDKSNVPFPTGNYYLFTIADSTSAVTELSESNNSLAVMGSIQLRAPAPDLTVTRLEAAASGAVGEVMPVLRTLKNIGNVDSPAVKYRYFASANAIITPDDVPLLIVNGAATAIEGTVTLAIGAADTTTELVKLPATMPPGTYYLGCIIDTGSAVGEIDETNNALASNTVQVAASSLRISTTQLPDAVVGRPYSYRLVAQGEQGPSSWSIDPSQGTLPMGMTLGTDGLVSGTPATPAVIAFTAVVSNNMRDAAARLVLRVLPTTTQVDITTTSVPPVINTPAQKYEFSLGAAGGVKPYAWRLASGTLPANLILTSDGVITGNPRNGLALGVSKVTLEVQDSLGTRAQKDLSIRVVAPGSIVFKNLSLPDALVGNDYGTDIAVSNADGTALSTAQTPLIWTKMGELPDGLVLTPASSVISVEGTPLRAGTFTFTMSVEDAQGRTDTADFTIEVYPARFKLTATGLPELVRPGDQVTFKITAASQATPVFDVYSGNLPPGLALGPDGTVTGTVATDKSEGTWNFVVEAKDETGASGLGAFTLEVKREVKAGGCSETGGTGNLWILAALVPLMLRRRSLKAVLRPLAAVAAVLLLVAPLSARAQGVYQVVGPSAVTYTPITGGTTVTVCGSTFTNCIYSYQGFAVPLTFPFKFYGQSVSQITMTQHGYLVISGDDGTSSNLGIPHNTAGSFYPQTFLAPWWDSIATPAIGSVAFRYQTFGTAPNRYLVFEWVNVAPSAATTSKISFEVILYESTNQIRFAYGPTAPTVGSASVGIQNMIGDGIAALTCTNSSSGTCGTSDFPTSAAIDFFLPPDLQVGAISGDQTGFSGVAYRANALLRNTGGRAANNALVRFFLSSDATLDALDAQIGDGQPVSVPAGGEVLVTANGPIPSTITPGQYFLIAKADPDDTIVEQSELNNIGTPVQISVGTPTADLVVTSVAGPATATPGATITVNRVIGNPGNAAAGAFKYTWFLSDNAVVTISDLKLDPIGTVSSLAAGASDTRMETLTLPANTPSGKFWIGLCVNYDPGATPQFGIAEITQVNNCATALPGMIVSTGALTVLTKSLPPSNQYSPYGLRLEATGGDGTFVWSLGGGTLPPGISLSAAGDLQGTPAVSGTFSFDVKVASGGQTQTASLQLMVATGSLPLAVVDQQLPAAEFSRPYLASLVAVGGKPPYIWSLKADNRLPAGLALATDGQLEGRASEGGTFLFSVECKDSAGTIAGKDLSLKVVNPATLHIATSGLPTGYLKQSYLQALQAVGGKAPYTWSLVKFQQLPQNPTEIPGAVVGDGKSPIMFPTNFGLAIEDGGNGIKYLRGTPKAAGLYSLTLQVTDDAGAADFTQLLLRISYVEGLAIVTTALPDAFIGHDYQVKIGTNVGPDATVQFQVPCVEQATAPGMFACSPTDARQALPPGLILAADGTITGTAIADGVVTPPAVYSFLVKVTDDQGRQDVRGLAIKVRPDFSVGTSSGCSGSGLEPSALSLLLAGALTLRLRRRRG